MPLIHFSGNFKYQLAYFNNEPKNDARKPDSYDLQLNDENLKVKFDSNLSPDEIHQRLLCDPTLPRMSKGNYQFITISIGTPDRGGK